MNSKNTPILFILFLALAFTFVGCKNDDDADGGSGNYFMKATVGGAEHNFSNDLRASWVEGKTFLNITGYHDNSFITITLMNDSKRATAGQYTLDDASGFQILSIYSPNGGQENYTASHGTVWDDQFQINITDINDKTVKGSFSGDLVIGGGGATVAKRIKIENGTFNVPFK